LNINLQTKRLTKTYKISYIASSTWRQIFLIKGNDLYKSKEKFIYDRSSTISPLFSGVQVNIYSGNRFNTKNINPWMVGFKFGEFTWNRKLALYKAKQLKKKKK
jgi:ribosomal protein S19